MTAFHFYFHFHMAYTEQYIRKTQAQLSFLHSAESLSFLRWNEARLKFFCSGI